MKIERLFYNCRNSEVYATTGRISDAYRQSSLTADAGLANILNEIDPKNQKLIDAIKRMIAESELEVKDEDRDSDHHALHYLVYGATFNPDTNVKTAASEVFNVMENYGLSVTGESYDTETTYLESLLEDLAKPNLRDAIAAIPGCAEQIANLQASQNAFSAARLAFQQEQAKNEGQESATSLKKQVLILVNEKLVAFLNGMLVTAPDTFSEFAATVNKIIGATNETVKKRRNAKSKEKETVIE